MGPNPLSAPHQRLVQEFEAIGDIFERSPALFNNFGGVTVWKELIQTIATVRGAQPWKFSAWERSIRAP